jgi:hypothetical protein
MGPGKLGREALLEEERMLTVLDPDKTNGNYDDLFNHHTTRDVMDQFAMLFA